MKTLVKTGDVVQLRLYQELLKAEGIASYIGNENSASVWPLPGEATSPFCPELIIVDEELYSHAMQVLNTYRGA